MLWLLIVALVSFIYSFWSGALTFREGRRPMDVEGTLLSWEEAPRSMLWQDSQVGMLIILQSVCMLLLAAFGLQAGLKAWEAPSMTASLPIQLIFFGLLSLTTLYVSRTAGLALVFPLLSSRIGPIPIRLLEDGVLHGRVKIKWGKFGWVVPIPGSRGLHLRSKRNREITLLSLMPETDDHLQKVNEILAARINKPSAQNDLPWLERKSTFAFLYLSTVIPFLLIGIIVSVSFLSWGFLYFGLATFFANSLSARVLRYYFS